MADVGSGVELPCFSPYTVQRLRRISFGSISCPFTIDRLSPHPSLSPKWARVKKNLVYGEKVVPFVTQHAKRDSAAGPRPGNSKNFVNTIVGYPYSTRLTYQLFLGKTPRWISDKKCREWLHCKRAFFSVL